MLTDEQIEKIARQFQAKDCSGTNAQFEKKALGNEIFFKRAIREALEMNDKQLRSRFG